MSSRAPLKCSSSRAASITSFIYILIEFNTHTLLVNWAINGWMLYGNLCDTLTYTYSFLLLLLSVKCQVDDYRHCCEIGNLMIEKRKYTSKTIVSFCFCFSFLSLLSLVCECVFCISGGISDTGMSFFRTNVEQNNKRNAHTKTCSCILLTDYMMVPHANVKNN